TVCPRQSRRGRPGVGGPVSPQPSKPASSPTDEVYQLQLVAGGDAHLAVSITAEDVPVVLDDYQPGVQVEAVQKLLDGGRTADLAALSIQPDVYRLHAHSRIERKSLTARAGSPELQMAEMAATP